MSLLISFLRKGHLDKRRAFFDGEMLLAGRETAHETNIRIEETAEGSMEDISIVLPQFGKYEGKEI